MRPYTTLGHIFFAILAILAAYFYAERTIFIDSAFQIFKILYFESWNIEAGRYSVVITQALPLLMIKLGAPLNAVLLSYSLSFILVYYLVYCLVIYKFKNEVAGISIVFLLFLGIQQSFFHIATETHQGLVYTVLLYAWLFYSHDKSSTILKYGVALVLVMLCYFAHPITLFPILFIYGFYAIEKKLLDNWHIYLMAIITVAIFLFKLIITPSDSYEGDQFAQIGQFVELFPKIRWLSSTQFFLSNLDTLYYPAFLMFAILTVHYWKKCELLKLGYVGGSALLFVIISILTFHRGDSVVMMEKNFMPLTILAAIPFAYEILVNKAESLKLKLTAVVIVLFISIVNISLTGRMLSGRLEYMDSLLAMRSSPENRMFITERSNLDMDTIMVPWAIAIETLLYSSLEGPSNSRTLFTVDKMDKFEGVLDDENTCFITAEWRDWSIRDMNQEHFQLGTNGYQVISNQE